MIYQTKFEFFFFVGVFILVLMSLFSVDIASYLEIEPNKHPLSVDAGKR